MNRVDRLKTLIAEQFEGSQKEFAKAIKKSPSQISHWLNGVRAIGDGVAAQIETALDLPRGWMDGKESRGDVYVADTAEPRPGFIRIELMNKPAVAGSSESTCPKTGRAKNLARPSGKYGCFGQKAIQWSQPFQTGICCL